MKTPKYLIIKVVSDDRISMDIEVKVPRGQDFHIGLGPEEVDNFKVNITSPGECPRDQQRYIATKDGLVQAPFDEPW